MDQRPRNRNPLDREGVPGANPLSSLCSPGDGGGRKSVKKRIPGDKSGISVLVADHDAALHRRVYRAIESGLSPYCVASAFNGEEAVWMLRRFQGVPSGDRLLVVADFHLIGRDGLDLCRFIRSQPSLAAVPFLMVCGEGDPHDLCMASLEAGADDFLSKPFSIREFEARLGALLRRMERNARKQADFPFDRFQAGPLIVDTQKYEVRISGRIVPLTHKEFLVCVALVSKCGLVVRHEEFFQSVWGDKQNVGKENLKVHVHSLRSKLGEGTVIEAIRSVGYRLRVEA